MLCARLLYYHWVLCTYLVCLPSENDCFTLILKPVEPMYAKSILDAMTGPRLKWENNTHVYIYITVFYTDYSPICTSPIVQYHFVESYGAFYLSPSTRQLFTAADIVLCWVSQATRTRLFKAGHRYLLLSSMRFPGRRFSLSKWN